MLIEMYGCAIAITFTIFGGSTHDGAHKYSSRNSWKIYGRNSTYFLEILYISTNALLFNNSLIE